MKHRTFAILLVVIMLIASYGSALAQGKNPPAGSEPLPKSAFMSPGMDITGAFTPALDAVPSLATQPVANYNFEQGAYVGWGEYSLQGWPVVTPSTDLPIFPYSGNWAAWLGGDDSENAYISQSLTLPSSASLRLMYWVDSIDDCGYDYAYVLIKASAASTYTIFHTWELCFSQNTNGWVPLDINLSAYSGQAVDIKIQLTTDVGYFSSLFIDDVSLYGTFADVAYGHWAEDFVLRLYNAGITGGCGTYPLMYCPETAVTRAQMAVFLLRGIHGSSYAPPAVGVGTGFVDVPADYWSGAWIKQLAAEGITGGCGIGMYCPEAAVTRDQMAVFLLRAKYGAAYTPPSPGMTTGFGDVPATYWAAAWIKQLVAEGITSGCGNGNYCPQNPVTRAQMAVFLVRTFSLP